MPRWPLSLELLRLAPLDGGTPEFIKTRGKVPTDDEIAVLVRETSDHKLISKVMPIYREA